MNILRGSALVHPFLRIRQLGSYEVPKYTRFRCRLRAFPSLSPPLPSFRADLFSGAGTGHTCRGVGSLHTGQKAKRIRSLAEDWCQASSCKNFQKLGSNSSLQKSPPRILISLQTTRSQVPAMIGTVCSVGRLRLLRRRSVVHS